MPTKEIPTSDKKKQVVLNKFLSKTYHLIDQCDPSIAFWSNSGDSFTVRDIEGFEKQVLPLYFNHGKFSSFTRQLNFYGFQKIRLDADLQRNNASVRFFHEYFRQGHPELLSKISRTTAKGGMHSSSSNDQVEALQGEVARLQEHVNSLTQHMEEKVERVADAIKTDYMLRIHKMEAAYAELYAAVVLGSVPSQITSSPSMSLQYPKSIDSEDYARFLQSRRRV